MHRAYVVFEVGRDSRILLVRLGEIQGQCCSQFMNTGIGKCRDYWKYCNAGSVRSRSRGGSSRNSTMVGKTTKRLFLDGRLAMRVFLDLMKTSCPQTFKALETIQHIFMFIILSLFKPNIRALIITYTILGVPYYTYNVPQNPILIIKAPI